MPKHPKKSVDQLAKELGKYPADALFFVQKCLGIAAEQVHGCMSDDETAVAEWMAQNEANPDELCRRWEEKRLPPDIIAALKRMGGPSKMNRHVSGQQLCFAIRDTALKRWGLMARSVLARWGIERTEDIGAIIFALVDNGTLQKEPTDTLADFENLFSFDDEFVEAYRIKTNL